MGFDGGEVLDLVAGAAAQVLPEPVHQLREVQRIQRRAPVVVGGRVDRDALGGDPPVRREREGDEHRGPVGLAVRGGEHPPDRPILHRHPRQVRDVLTAPGRAHPPGVLVALALDVVVGLVVASAGCHSGSVSRCQPSRHCCIRSRRARSAHAGQRCSRVEPHAIGTRRSSPVSMSVTLEITGRAQTPATTAASATSSGASAPFMPRPVRGGGRLHAGRAVWRGPGLRQGHGEEVPSEPRDPAPCGGTSSPLRALTQPRTPPREGRPRREGALARSRRAPVIVRSGACRWWRGRRCRCR